VRARPRRSRRRPSLRHQFSKSRVQLALAFSDLSSRQWLRLYLHCPRTHQEKEWRVCSGAGERRRFMYPPLAHRSPLLHRDRRRLAQLPRSRRSPIGARRSHAVAGPMPLRSHLCPPQPHPRQPGRLMLNGYYRNFRDGRRAREAGAFRETLNAMLWV
jgi:hypothetical protein